MQRAFGPILGRTLVVDVSRPSILIYVIRYLIYFINRIKGRDYGKITRRLSFPYNVLERTLVASFSQFSVLMCKVWYLYNAIERERVAFCTAECMSVYFIVEFC